MKIAAYSGQSKEFNFLNLLGKDNITHLLKHPHLDDYGLPSLTKELHLLSLNKNFNHFGILYSDFGVI